MTRFWLASRPNILEFSYVLSSNTYESNKMLDPNIFGFSYTLSISTYWSGKMLDPISLGSTTCWAQVHMDLMRCQTQHLRVQLCTKPKYMEVWRDIRPNTYEYSHTLRTNAYGSAKTSDPTLWVQLRPKLSCMMVW